MAAGRSQRAGAWLARILLAYALLTQGLLGGAVAGQHAAHLAAGTPGEMCLGATAPGGTPQGQSDLALCCLFSCGLAAAQPALDAPAAAFEPAPRAVRPVLYGAARATAQPAALLLAFEARGPPAGI